MSVTSDVDTFADATAVRHAGDGRYQADVRAEFGFDGAPNGGYLLAIMLRAAAAESSHLHPIVASAEYLHVAQAGEAEVVVETSRVSRTLATAVVTLRQHERAVAQALVTVATLAQLAQTRWSVAAPTIPPVDACAAASSRRAGLAQKLDLRFDPAVDGWRDDRPSGRPEMRAWLRLRDDTPPDPFVLALAVDALPPVTVNLGLRGWAPTVRLNWQLRGLPSAGWMAVHASGRTVSDRWFDEDVEVWDAAGNLVAQSRQLALLGQRHVNGVSTGGRR